MKSFALSFIFTSVLVLSNVETLWAVTHPGDAAIRAVQFVDDREGWAVGDDGVIWHSIDGGRKWEEQASGVRASLRSVHFLTPYTGWIVGRIETPSGSRGVVLSTTDGGLKWVYSATQPLPGLNTVRFFTQRNGVAAGDGCDGFPTGLFNTNDGGRTWKPVPGKRCPTWLTADFSDAETGVLGGPWSQLATVRDGLFGAADVDPLGGRSVKALKLQGSFAVAVGQGGLILTSSNSAGLKWGFATPNLPKEVLASCDFNAVAVQGKHLWVAGRPGTMIWHSPDLGRTWEMQRTGQPLPLHGLCFVNETTGWATGEMGTILSTTDGGLTWKVARQDAQRLAVLFVHARSHKTPLETIALLGEEDGYHTGALRLTCVAAPTVPQRHPDDTKPQLRKVEATGAPPHLALDPEKLSGAMRQVGGTVGEVLWHFPLPAHQEGLTGERLLAQWDKSHDEQANRQVLRQLVLAIRLWRPEVLVTDAIGSDPAETLAIEAIKEAFKAAEDANAFPEQISTLLLTTWAPKKLYTIVYRIDPTVVRMPISEVKTRLGDCARDFAQPAAMTLTDRPERVGDRGYRLLATRLPNSTGDLHLLDGITLAFGGQARRELPPVDEDVIKARVVTERAVKKRQFLEFLARGEVESIATPEQVLAQIGPAIREMPAELGARAAHALALQYVQAGQWTLAREAFLMMADRFPTHPLTLEAYRWVVRHQCSSEARRRQELGHFLNYTETAVQSIDPKETRNAVKGGTEIVQASHQFILKDFENARQWLKGAIALEPRLAGFGPLYANDPALQLCLMSARRQLGEADTVKKWCSRYLSETASPLGGQTVVRGADPWRDCAMAELWLTNRAIGASPGKPLGYCSMNMIRPTLDGKLDDDCWQGITPMTLATTAGDLNLSMTTDAEGKRVPAYTTRTWFATDREYLYIAVDCTHPAGKRVPKLEKRSRDMDLRPYDRVSLMIDLDRDYATYFQLQIDQRGALAEDCWGDTNWNPAWFVAVDSHETGWTAEAAIPLKELTGEALMPGKVWAVNATRIVPGNGVQAWSTPADVRPRPEGMGLMQFIEKK